MCVCVWRTPPPPPPYGVVTHRGSVMCAAYTHARTCDVRRKTNHATNGEGGGVTGEGDKLLSAAAEDDNRVRAHCSPDRRRCRRDGTARARGHTTRTILYILLSP